MLVERKGNGDFTITREPSEELSVEEQNLAIAILWYVPDMELWNKDVLVTLIYASSFTMPTPTKNTCSYMAKMGRLS